MVSGNAFESASQRVNVTSGNTDSGEAASIAVLPLEYTAALVSYQRGLRAAPLAGPTRVKYVSRIRGYLVWLASSDRNVETDADPLEESAARDGAVRDWRAWAKTVARRRPATINNTLAAIDDFHTRPELRTALATWLDQRRSPPRRGPRRKLDVHALAQAIERSSQRTGHA
jgi:hypothetical protein